jgi:hypothetical protein
MNVARTANNPASRLADAIGALSVLGMAYCLAAYAYLIPRLTPNMPEPGESDNRLGAFVALAILVAGVYHLILLVRVIRSLGRMPSGRFLHSLYLVAVVVSGLSLATEPVQLSEIGKEYVLFDVRGQWAFLIVSTIFHLAVMTVGFFYTRRKGSGAVESRNDAFYITMHQVGIVCGALGIMGLISFNQWGVPERYQPLLILVLSALALTPWIIILVFLMAGNRTKPLSAWFDEKQATDTAVGALCAMLAAMPAMVALSAFLLDDAVILPLPRPLFSDRAGPERQGKPGGTLIRRTKPTQNSPSPWQGGFFFYPAAFRNGRRGRAEKLRLKTDEYPGRAFSPWALFRGSYYNSNRSAGLRRIFPAAGIIARRFPKSPPIAVRSAFGRSHANKKIP